MKPTRNPYTSQLYYHCCFEHNNARSDARKLVTEWLDLHPGRKDPRNWALATIAYRLARTSGMKAARAALDSWSAE